MLSLPKHCDRVEHHSKQAGPRALHCSVMGDGSVRGVALVCAA